MMKVKACLVYTILCLFLTACIGEDIIDDFVKPELRIRNPITTLNFSDSYLFEARYLNNIGLPEAADVMWSSSDDAVIQIDMNTGKAKALKAGEAIITATYLADSLSVATIIRVTGSPSTPNDANNQNDGESGNNTGDSDEGSEEPGVAVDQPEAMSRSGVIATTSTYKLSGDYNLEFSDSGALVLSLADNYEASTSLPGLYVYLTNNPNSINGALELAKVTVFEGAHNYMLPADVTITDYSYIMYWCKPFSVKVGGGNIEE